MPRKPQYDKNELIDRARDLFWKQGWAGTSLKDLEKTLQMKPGSFYAAFGSKDALFQLALDKYALDGRLRLQKLAHQVGAMQALQRYPVMIVERSTAPAKACMLSKTMIELQSRNHPMATRAKDHLQDMEDFFSKLFSDAQANGDLLPEVDPKALSRRYLSDISGLQISTERIGLDARPIALEIANTLKALQPSSS